MTVSNNDFLTAIFGDDAAWAHVTDFADDPANIPSDRHLVAWSGNYFSRYQFGPQTNQYFTISAFYADDAGRARRRKALYRYTPAIVLDDVHEKLPINEVLKLPAPSWILETSPGSEQWGYILDEPCTDRARVENLLDGLVANGLAPQGRDPGMKGVTRYVRLPEGYNSKASKLVDGLPFKCVMKSWRPDSKVTMEQLAEPFSVNLDAERREARVDGAASVSDHPLINIPKIIEVKEVRSDGRFDITCPWVADHTGADDSGSAVFTNGDGSIGFKCHHGSCQSHTGADLLRFIENRSPGFKSQLSNWQIMRDFGTAVKPKLDFATPRVPPAPVSISPARALDFSTPRVVEAPSSPVKVLNFAAPQAPAAPVAPHIPDAPVSVPAPTDGLQMLCDKLKRENPTSNEARQIAGEILRHADQLSAMDKKHWHDEVSDLMHWAKTDLKDILKDLRKQWYDGRVSSSNFYENLVYVKELNQFYDWGSRIFFTAEAFQNSFSHEDAEARRSALQEGKVQKVDRMDYAPLQPRIFVEGKCTYANLWSEESQSRGRPGDISKWQEHFRRMGWGDHRKHVEQWMAYTLRHPDKKINHMLLLGSGEGGGKDYLLYPLVQAMGENCTVISGEELLDGFNDYLLSTKYLHVNETELGDRREAVAVSNKLKPLAAAPPETLRVNQKNIKPIKIRNIVNGSMTTNTTLPFRINGPSRRFLALWSDLNIRDEYDNMLDEWLLYWADRWAWMKDQSGWEAVVHYLYTAVDLSDFNPQAAPPMTDFLREIRSGSQPPLAATIETFIRKRIGSFQADILHVDDIVATLHAGPMIAPEDMGIDVKHVTSTRAGTSMREAGYQPIDGYNIGTKVKLWLVRDHARYAGMNGGDLYREYEAQIRRVRNGSKVPPASPLKIVN